MGAIAAMGRSNDSCRVLTLDREVSRRVDALAQVLAWLEVRHVLPGQGNGFTRLRIAANAWRPKVQRKTAESANLDPLPLGERVAHQIEQVFDREFDVLGRQMFLFARDNFYEF